MKIQLFFLNLFFLLGLFSCKSSTEVSKSNTQNISVKWKLESNQISEKPAFRATFTLQNNGTDTLNNNWKLYFNQTNRSINKSDGAAKVEVIKGDWYKMTPNDNFKLMPNETIEIPYEGGAWMIKEADAPAGLYFTFLDKNGKETSVKAVSNYEILPFEKEEQILRHHADYEKMPTAERFFEENSKLSLLSENEILPIIPSPIDYQELSHLGSIQIDDSYKIGYYYDLEPEAIFLQNALKQFGLNLEIVKANNTREKRIILESGQSIHHAKSISKPETDYNIRISEASQLKHPPKKEDVLDNGNITIHATKKAGIFYGIQSLLQMIPLKYYGQKTDKIIFPKTSIYDTARFPYRGVHLDIARNFQDKNAIKKLIDIMAFYKLNKLHLHLTEDEGWRLEIEELPELTEYGSKRGHTLTEENHLQPSYGSGHDVAGKSGSGYLTRADFKEILQYADARYIEVIPEINVPGHARAAIKAMDYRYKKLMEKGDETSAKEFLLRDFEDKSEYFSVQNYPDNVVCPCQESTYYFYETVVADIVEQYEEAGLTLKTLHTGGDEVPKGVWEKSPLCQQQIAENEQIKTAYDLTYYFRDRVSKILAKYNLTMAGWEEIALRKEASGRYVPNEDFQNSDFLPFVWNNLWGAQDLGNRLANAGYPTVLCNVTNLYFDLAYNNDPKEPGFYWGGFVDTKKAWEFMPFEVLNSTYEDAMGKPFDLENDYKNMERLTPEGEQNIVGIQGQLWSETIKGSDMLEYYYLPKMLGLAERAWAQQPDWAKIEDSAGHQKAQDEAWNIFANTLGQKELRKLDFLFGGFNYRKPTIGEKEIDGKMLRNVAFPGFEVKD